MSIHFEAVSARLWGVLAKFIDGLEPKSGVRDQVRAGLTKFGGLRPIWGNFDAKFGLVGTNNDGGIPTKLGAASIELGAGSG